MDMSLDDIITSTKGAKRGGGRGRGRGGARGAGGRGQVGRGRTSASGARRGGGTFNRNPNFRGRDAAPRRSMMGLRSAGATGTSKITISNLHFGVTDADITELFSELGAIKFASVHYDRSGRSMGKADILFERRASAQQAIQQYNGVPLDGRAMEITWADAKPAATTGTSPRGVMNRTQGGRVNRNSGGTASRIGFKAGRGSGTTGGRGRGRGGRGGRTQTKPPTAEELDAELDAYVSANTK